ncbi:disulfide bond formation protein B [Pseudomonas chlororaphis]|uniref:Disulfide bond formation protein B n=1 Tax=Pseudomonas morbosilactucae TaxID=2938197 RepID=A0ABT0JJ27_9PSED|nr:disulfide bond formation protein B [Pseudomonas morbosilactucae]MCK9815927.1 disulfide bond formation protein B [Pseudomonas morbosilactucae]ROL73484.1 disulfide bond formation protein B [Pseudomonas chlororaphis]
MSLAGSRVLFSLMFLLGALASWAAFYLQSGGGLDSCPLWSAQRGLLVVLGVSNLIAAAHGPRRLGRLLYWGLNLFWGLLGVVTAGRHVLLQNIPSEQLLACVPDLPFMLRHFSWWQTLQLAFKGTSDCAEVSWTLLDMSLPEWSLLVFVAVLMVSGYQLWRRLQALWQVPVLS